MTAEEQTNIRNFVEGLATSVIMKPSARDEQAALGPSDLADKCDLCVGRKIAASLHMGSPPVRNFSMKAWNGTAVHEKMERDLPSLYSGAELEVTIDVAHVPGIGLIRGHADLYLPRKKTLVDYKTTDLKKLKGYQKDAGPGSYTQGMSATEREVLRDLKKRDRAGLLTGDDEIKQLVALSARSDAHSGGVPQEYMGQTMLYLYGLRAMGREADYAVLLFIPRDSNNVSDIWAASCAYRPDVAQAVLNRAASLAEIVRKGLVRELVAHSGCWTCSIRPRLSR
jgi:hypothetical protein